MMSYVGAELLRRPTRAVSAMLSVALGIAVFLGLQAYSVGYQAAARAPLSEVGADITVQRQGDVPEAFDGIVFPHSVAPIHRDEIEAMASIPGVEGVAESLFFWSFEGDRFVAGLGLEPAVGFGPGRLRAGLVDGRFLEEGDEWVVVVDASFATQNGLGVGEAIVVAGRSLAVVGVVDSTSAGTVANANLYIPLEDAQALASIAPNVLAVHDMRPDDANLLFVKAEQTRAEEVAIAAEEIMGDRALVSAAESFSEQLGALFGLVDRFGVIVGLVALSFAVAVVLRTVAASVWERRREIGMMRAVGWRRRDVSRLLMTEALAVTTSGATVGLGLALLLTMLMRRATVTIPVPWELTPSPHFLPGGADEVAVVVPLAATITPTMALVAFGLSVLAAALVGLWSTRRLANIKPAEVLRSE